MLEEKEGVRIGDSVCAELRGSRRSSYKLVASVNKDVYVRTHINDACAFKLRTLPRAHQAFRGRTRRIVVTVYTYTPSSQSHITPHRISDP